VSKLIINEHPLLVLPSLATAIGLNEAIILQQIHYWLDPRVNKNIINGVSWVYNTYNQWAKQFPFWSEITIRRTIRSLEKEGLLISRYCNDKSFNKQKWYTIDYSVLKKIDQSTPEKKYLSSADQNDQTTDHFDQSSISKRSDNPIKLIASYNITETTTKTTTSLSLSNSDKDVKNQDFKEEREMIEIWNKIVKKGENPSRVTETRLASLQKVLRTVFHNDLNKWTSFCQLVTRSKFLMGEVNSFKASLDWCLKPEVIQKIQEGEYGVGDRVGSIAHTENEIVELEEDASNPLWQEARKHIIAKLGMATFKSWITKLDFLEEADGVIYLKAASRFVKDYIETHYQNSIISAWKQINPQIREVNISFA
jgi:hypothetical protein